MRTTRPVDTRWYRSTAVMARAPFLILLSVLVACVTPIPSPLVLDPEEAARVRVSIEAGLELYDAGDYVLSAERFQSAAKRARDFRDFSLERKTITAECTAWLRAQRVGEFANCTRRLETLHRRSRRSDLGLNTLLVMGAVAGGRPIPPFRVPNAVRPTLRLLAKEMR